MRFGKDLVCILLTRTSYVYFVYEYTLGTYVGYLGTQISDVHLVQKNMCETFEITNCKIPNIKFAVAFYKTDS